MPGINKENKNRQNMLEKMVFKSLDVRKSTVISEKRETNEVSPMIGPALFP